MLISGLSEEQNTADSVSTKDNLNERETIVHADKSNTLKKARLKSFLPVISLIPIHAFDADSQGNSEKEWRWSNFSHEQL